VEHHLSGGLEEEELEERVQDLLHHLVILLLGSQQILQHLDKIRVGHLCGNSFCSDYGAYQHDAFEDNVILRKAVNEVAVDELNKVGLGHDLLPLVRVDVHHCAK